MNKQQLRDLLAVRGRLGVTLAGSEDTVRVTTAAHIDALDESVEVLQVGDLFSARVEALEERRVIKRKYGEHAPIHINDNGPVRNAVIEFVGNRFITEEEMEAFLNKVDEGDGARKPNYRKWLSRNERYFESVTVKGKKLRVLSKLGKRVFEHILERQKANEGSLPFAAWQLERDLLESMDEAARLDESMAFPGTYRIMNCLAKRELYERVVKSHGLSVISATNDSVEFRANTLAELQAIATVMRMERDRNAYLLSWNGTGGASHVNLFDLGRGIDSLLEAVTMKPSERGDSVRKVIEFAVRNMAKGQTEDSVVSKLAGIRSFADLYAAAMELMDPTAKPKFEAQFAVKESAVTAGEKELKKSVLTTARFLLDSFNAATGAATREKCARKFYDAMSEYLGRGWHCDNRANEYVTIASGLAGSLPRGQVGMASEEVVALGERLRMRHATAEPVGVGWTTLRVAGVANCDSLTLQRIFDSHDPEASVSVELMCGAEGFASIECETGSGERRTIALDSICDCEARGFLGGWCACSFTRDR